MSLFDYVLYPVTWYYSIDSLRKVDQLIESARNNAAKFFASEIPKNSKRTLNTHFYVIANNKIRLHQEFGVTFQSEVLLSDRLINAEAINVKMFGFRNYVTHLDLEFNADVNIIFLTVYKIGTVWHQAFAKTSLNLMSPVELSKPIGGSSVYKSDEEFRRNFIGFIDEHNIPMEHFKL